MSDKEIIETLMSDKELIEFRNTPRLQYSPNTDTVYIVLNNDKYDVTDSFDVIEHWRKE